MRNVLSRNLANTFLILAIQFLLLLVLYALMRMGFYFYNHTLFPQVGVLDLSIMLGGGVLFDIVALLYLNILYILLQVIPWNWKYNSGYQRGARLLFIVTNSVGIAANLIDFAYYPFTLKRTTGTFFTQFSHEQNIGSLFLDFTLDYWPLVFVFFIAVFVLSRIARIAVPEQPKIMGWRFYSVHSILLLLVAFLFIGGVRGGWAHSTRPITLSNAGDFVKTPEEMNIVLNTPFSILKTLKAVALKPVNYYSKDEINKVYPVIHRPSDTVTFRKMNVVFLILESFAKEHVGALNHDIQGGNYRGYTPFLDSLIQASYTFNRSYANGRKSIDALPSIISGIPSVGEPFVLSIYSGNKTTSIAELLGAEGYQTAFFHGAPNGSMGFSAYAKLAGIKHYFGKTEYNNDKDFDGIWGIWDEPFMQFMAKKLGEFREPFFASFFSLSSHHPFKVPAAYAGKFPKGPLPVQEPVGYTDYALRQFFERVKHSDWYDNTLFVICADHATVSYLPEYNTASNAFAIPIIFYHPGGQLKGMSDKLVQQIDIMPTVLQYIGFDKPYFSFGFDALSKDRNNFLVNNIGGVYNFFQGDYYMSHDGDRPISLFNLKVDRFEKDNLVSKLPATVKEMDGQLKAFIQQYNRRMIDNDLVAP
ncbi:sulfatase-like hydrolase/transferase [Sphingobacterium shayense]|uniref:LTA synthase family protein n=1 Tax=Sphingobacterium shayense TaxID=626343 RepID=UPI001557CDDF|nr:sulfatase-like hydrolase/transferase [Sphingobacterium shayense]NQD72113.1 sulfatase-like hydrolase/transferase [Sphingobacterium shayense]